MKLIPFLTFLVACNPFMWKAAEDAVVGEVKVAEQVIDDLTGSGAKKGLEITLPVKKF